MLKNSLQAHSKDLVVLIVINSGRPSESSATTRPSRSLKVIIKESAVVSMWKYTCTSIFRPLFADCRIWQNQPACISSRKRLFTLFLWVNSSQPVNFSVSAEILFNDAERIVACFPLKSAPFPFNIRSKFRIFSQSGNVAAALAQNSKDVGTSEKICSI